MTKTKLVLFDWNGTFINDESQTVESFRDVLEGVGDSRYQLDKNKLTDLHRQTFEIPLKKMYESLGLSLDQAQMAKENLFWKTKYSSLEATIEMQPGIKESLEFLQRNGISYGILSNHVVDSIARALEKYGYSNVVILANAHDHEAHVEGKLHRLENYLQKNPDTELLAIVGDTTEEIEIAKTCKTKSIIFSNGWSTIERVQSASPDYLIDSSELPKLLKSLIS